MSLKFNDTEGQQGIIQVIEDEIGLRRGEISDNAQKLAKFTADVNIAFTELVAIILDTAGIWQWDDTNQGHYATITTDLHPRQRDYSFIDVVGDPDDETVPNNLILDILKVLVKQPDGLFRELDLVDQQQDKGVRDFWSGENVMGVPTHYDLSANGIFIDPLPNYGVVSGGMKLYVNREQTFFTVDDTDKIPGVDARIHRFLALHPAYRYARTKRLPHRNDLYKELYGLNNRDSNSLVSLVKIVYSRRQRDKVVRIIPNIDSTR